MQSLAKWSFKALLACVSKIHIMLEIQADFMVKADREIPLMKTCIKCNSVFPKVDIAYALSAPEPIVTRH